MGRQILEREIEDRPKDKRRKYLAVDDKEVDKLMKQLKPIRPSGEPKTEAELRHEARRKLTYAAALKVSPKYSLYVLRHSWATHALERGIDSLTVAILMGHQDPSTLAKVYQHLALNPKHMLEQAKRAAG